MEPIKTGLGLGLCLLLANAAVAQYENPADYPLMGDWTGKWIDPKDGHEAAHPEIAAQLVPVQGGSHYRVVILPELYNRAEPYLEAVVAATHDKVEIKQNGFEVVFSGTKVRGKAELRGKTTEFELTHRVFAPPSLGMKPPAGATVIFDGSSLDAWQHTGGKAVTWSIEDGAIQVVSKHKKANSEKGWGGDIETRSKFGSMRFHLEFRYPVEADKSGQMRGNSGLFFTGIGEIQILNSYTTPGYWNECGAFYKRIPATVNAAGPPLAWQTYDIDLELPKAEGDKAVVTVRLNGRTVHNKLELPCKAKAVEIALQDHINPVQFRNIWLKEE